MIVIGVDTHKRSHTIVALDAATGAARGQLTISATDEGTLDALRLAAELDDDRVWAVDPAWSPGLGIWLGEAYDSGVPG